MKEEYKNKHFKNERACKTEETQDWDGTLPTKLIELGWHNLVPAQAYLLNLVHCSLLKN